MESFFSRYRNALVLIAVLLVQVIGLAVQVRRPSPVPGDKGSVRLIRSWVVGIVTPPERILHLAGLGIRGIWDNYIDLIHVRQQNKVLQSQLDRLRLEEASIAEDARQAQRLQSLLGFREKYVYQTVAAQVVGTAGTEQSQVLLIDKGLRDGIRPDMPVITADGIVGKTRDVFGHSSQVLEISDSTSGAGVILEKTRIRGVLRGNSWGQPEIVNVSPDERIRPGETVLTSGGDAIFPRGLPVGVVDRVVPDPDGTLVNVLIKPAANLSRLEEVLVITSSGDQMPAEMRQDLADAQQRASDVLAERLPSRVDPNAPPDEQQDSTAGADGEVGRPMRPPQVVHADHYSPEDTPPAATLVPGQRTAPELSGPDDAGAVKAQRPADQGNPAATGNDNASGTSTHSSAPAGPGAAGASSGAVKKKAPTTETADHPASDATPAHPAARRENNQPAPNALPTPPPETPAAPHAPSASPQQDSAPQGRN